MTSGEMAGLIGGIAGGVGGLIGGIIGTAASIRHTRTIEARRFMIRASIVSWLIVLLFCISLFLILHRSRNYIWVPWILYAPVLGFGVRYINRRANELNASAFQSPKTDVQP